MAPLTPPPPPATMTRDLPRADQMLDQQNASVRIKFPYVPLDKKATIETMQILSFAVLTMIVGLSSYSAEILAPLAKQNLSQGLLISPYLCMAIALIGVALSSCASESNEGLADSAAMAILLACLYVIFLGRMAAVMILHAAHGSTLFWSIVLVICLVSCWGWLLAYPRCLKFNIRMICWTCFNRRRSNYSCCSSYAHPESAQRTEPKGFARILSNFGAACLMALQPLDEDRSIDVMKTLSRSVLTGISGLTLWAAHSVAPQAYMAHMYSLERILYGIPYFYIPLGVLAIAISTSASTSSGCASCGSCLVLMLCACGIMFGAVCSVIVLHVGFISSWLVGHALVICLVWVWGWIFAYPKALNCALRRAICWCSARCLNIQPVRCDGGCSRTARGWWTAGRATCTGGEVDVEAGIELTPVAVSLSPEEEDGAEKDIVLIPEVVGLA